ncbi:MAG TPA: catalase family peroxidase [Bryobacteraceae bacterium]|jgi:catalase
MPLPDDPKLIRLSEDLLAEFEKLFGPHPGFRPAHAKGLLLTGIFTPAAGAASLTRAPHVVHASTPVSVRFSNSTGLPLIPDKDPNANPRGMAIRFHLAEHVHTDIVSHSTDGFPTRTGAEFLEMLRALASNQIESFLATHPKALAFVQTPKPAPASFATEKYFGVTAMRFVNKDGVSRFGRYRIVPEAGVEHLSNQTLAEKGDNFLFDEISERIGKGPVAFGIFVQVADESDVVDDATVHWPEERQQVDLGRLVLDGVAPENASEQKKMIFDPVPRVDGIEPSPDPLLELRAAVYLLSGRQRRAAQV